MGLDEYHNEAGFIELRKVGPNAPINARLRAFFLLLALGFYVGRSLGPTQQKLLRNLLELGGFADIHTLAAALVPHQGLRGLARLRRIVKPLVEDHHLVSVSGGRGSIRYHLTAEGRIHAARLPKSSPSGVEGPRVSAEGSLTT